MADIPPFKRISIPPFKLDAKRVAFPLVFTRACPWCGLDIDFDLGGDGVDYPSIGEPFEVYALCDNPECDGSIQGAQIEVTLALSVRSVSMATPQ